MAKWQKKRKNNNSNVFRIENTNNNIINRYEKYLFVNSCKKTRMISWFVNITIQTETKLLRYQSRNGIKMIKLPVIMQLFFDKYSLDKSKLNINNYLIRFKFTQSTLNNLHAFFESYKKWKNNSKKHFVCLFGKTYSILVVINNQNDNTNQRKSVNNIKPFIAYKLDINKGDTPILYYCNGTQYIKPNHRIPKKPANHIRLVSFGCTHEFHEQLFIPNGDILIHCGDVCNWRRYDNTIERFKNEYQVWEHFVTEYLKKYAQNNFKYGVYIS